MWHRAVKRPVESNFKWMPHCYRELQCSSHVCTSWTTFFQRHFFTQLKLKLKDGTYFFCSGMSASSKRTASVCFLSCCWSSSASWSHWWVPASTLKVAYCKHSKQKQSYPLVLCISCSGVPTVERASVSPGKVFICPCLLAGCSRSPLTYVNTGPAHTAGAL